MHRKTTECTLRKYLIIRPAGTKAYEVLADFHYRDRRAGPHSHLFAIYDDHPCRQVTTPAAGVIVYRPPVPNLAIRNAVLDGRFSGLNRAAGLTLLNESVRCISRVIIDPRYRGLGLASWLVAETMPLTGAPLVEACSVMGGFHPFFKRAGMLEFIPSPDVKTERMSVALETVGIDQRLWADAEQVHRRIDSLDAPRRQFIEKQMSDFLQKFARQRTLPHGLERTDFILSKLGDPGRYYLWVNPEKTIRPVGQV